MASADKPSSLEVVYIGSPQDTSKSRTFQTIPHFVVQDIFEMTEFDVKLVRSKLNYTQRLEQYTSLYPCILELSIVLYSRVIDTSGIM